MAPVECFETNFSGSNNNIEGISYKLCTFWALGIAPTLDAAVLLMFVRVYKTERSPSECSGTSSFFPKVYWFHQKVNFLHSFCTILAKKKLEDQSVCLLFFRYFPNCFRLFYFQLGIIKTNCKSNESLLTNFILCNFYPTMVPISTNLIVHICI